MDLNYNIVHNFSSIIAKLSIFLFIIAGNYIGDIYSCGLRHLFNEYMYVKHIIGIFIILTSGVLIAIRETLKDKPLSLKKIVDRR